MRHLIPAAILTATLLAGCSESSTGPETSAPEKSPTPAAPTFSATLPGTNATINSGFCTLVSSTTGEVRCDYEVSNPDGLLLNVYPGATMSLDYQCVNPNTGKIASTGTRTRWTLAWLEGITATTITGSNVQLTTATLPNSYVKKSTKLNACKGKQELVITNYAMLYWEIYIDNWYSGQPSDQYKYTCLGLDDRYGCESYLIP